MKAIKLLGHGLLASALAISPALAKPGGGKGNSGDKGGGKPNKEKTVPHKSEVPGGKKDVPKPNKPEPPAKPDTGAALRRGNVEPSEAKRLAKQHQFAGQKPLPPGIRKNLLRGKPLPPGLGGTPIPPAYLRALPVYPGYEWRAYGSDLVLVSVASQIIADVIVDALL